MKTKMLIATLLGCLVWQQGALSQTDTVTTNSAAVGIAPTGATEPNQSVGTSTTTPTTPPVVSATESPNVTSSNAADVASVTNTQVVTTVTTTESGSTTTNNETASAASHQPAGAATIPLIQFQDVPITTAIENLARQAGINYLIDPRIGYGQPDQNGQIKPEPTLSIRWENVTAEQALMALLDNYSLQLIEDHRSQIARIAAKDPAALPSLATRVVQLKYAGTSNMVDAVQAALTDKRSRVLPDVRTSQIIIVATDKEQDAVDALINELDKPTRQVLIETKLVELSSNPSTRKGIDWSGTLAAQNISFGNGVTQPGGSLSTTLFPGTPTSTPFAGHTITTTPSSSSSTVQQTQIQSSSAPGGLSLNTLSGFAPAIGFLNADGVHAVLSFLNASSDAQVVSTPRLVTLDNEKATISVTRGYPVINVTASTPNSTAGSSITYSNIGTTLEVTPRISANDFIWLKVVPDVSSFFGVNQQTIAGSTYTADIFDSRHIETQVLIPNSNTLVMGGMVKDSPNAQYTKVPLLGDIPLLGNVFRSEVKSLDKDNLLIFITPTIVKETDFRPATSDFLKSKAKTMKSPMNPNTVWDSTHPGDWSNPVPTAGEFDNTPARME